MEWTAITPEHFKKSTPTRNGYVWVYGENFRWSVWHRRQPGESVEATQCLGHGEIASVISAKEQVESLLGATIQ